jgi:hypothetical protein
MIGFLLGIAGGVILAVLVPSVYKFAKKKIAEIKARSQGL